MNTRVSRRKIRVGITMGDPSGIGPAITSKAVDKLKGLADFVVIGDEWVFKKAQNAKRKAPASPAGRQSYKFIDLNNVTRQSFSFGKIKAEYGRASIEYLDKALGLVKNREIDCLVTAPISKEAINLAGFSYSGHTEYLAKNTHTRDFAMMLLNKALRVSLVTRHIPLKDVPAQINKDRISKTIFLTHRALKQIFKIKNPRVVVCGLNPHASDNGIIGKEENRVIKPAIEKLRAKFKIDINGPISSDVAIYQAKEGQYDAVIAMYHDQALIPLKFSADFTGVNMTLGLPFLRTSPLHGTAFDIAGKHKLANPN
ncbi:MAG: 4-hydroxythreonine-4-phosphate dehydrogenase PdxA, partial [Candidatus Omnitrophica bacterium]|nr:4-hydroxythreonine-4-phosphate dehydrogenase PdxA [Candidatus Omnitrophota bacterium]